MSDKQAMLSQKLKEAQDKLSKAEKELSDLKAKPIKEPVKRDFDIKRQKKEAEITELKQENRKTSSKLDELSAEKRELLNTLKRFQDLPINEEYAKELKSKKEAEERLQKFRGANQNDRKKMSNMRRELQAAGFRTNRDMEATFSYAAEIDKRIHQLEENLDNGVLGTRELSRLQHEKHLQKEISSMKKFRAKGEMMDKLMKKVKDSKESAEFKNAEKENAARKETLGSVWEQREASRQEMKGVRDSLDKIRKQIEEAQTSRTSRTDKMKLIQKESNDIRKNYRDLDTKYKEFCRKLQRVEQKVITCQRAVDEVMRDINQEETLKASVEEMEAADAAAASNNTGRGGQKPKNITPKNEKPQPQQPKAPAPEKKKKQRAPKKVEKEEEKEVSLVKTAVVANMGKINEITALIAYLKSLMPKGDASPSSQAGQTKRAGFNRDESVAEDDPMAALFNNKPQAKKKKKRRKKVVKDLKHSMNYYKMFNKFDVDYPQKVEEVPECLQALEKQLADLKDGGKSSKAPAKEAKTTEAAPKEAEKTTEEAPKEEEPKAQDAAAAGGPAESS